VLNKNSPEIVNKEKVAVIIMTCAQSNELSDSCNCHPNPTHPTAPIIAVSFRITSLQYAP